MRSAGLLSTLLISLSLAFSPPASAHHSPSEVIEAITQRIAKGERTASVFVQRGDEHRAVGNLGAALVDYQSALHLQAGYYSALYGMAQAHLSQSHWVKAQAVAKRGLVLARNENEAAPFHVISAHIHEQNHCWEMALTAWQHSLASSRPKVDWFLGESRSLKRLKRIDDALQALETAMQKNPSTVLRRAWIEMLIHGDKIHEAEKQISAGLARARWKSSWLLLRARLHLAQKNSEAAQQDARTALSEISRRQSPGSVNPFLAADRGLALLILGREEEAKADLELAHSLGVSHEKLPE